MREEDDEVVSLVQVHVSKPTKGGCPTSVRAATELMKQEVTVSFTIVLSETRGLQLYVVVRGGIESTSEP